MQFRTRGRRRLQILGLALATSALGFLSIGSASTSGATTSKETPATAPHIMTIMMENTDYSEMVGSPQMPYFNQLTNEYANFTQAYGWTYPSLPNYLELLSGSDWGTSGNDCDITDPGCSNFAGPTLTSQLTAAGLTWKAYYQGDEAGCYQGDGTGNYPYWHNAFRYFSDFSVQCKNISNFDDLIPNLDKTNAADFQWVVPDLVNSGGDNGTMQSGDSWLEGELPKIQDTKWYKDGGQIVILYDTGYNDRSNVVGFEGGQIPMVVVSAHTEGMSASSTPISTAGVLRSIEHAYGLSYLGNAKNPSYGNLGDALLSTRPAGKPAAQISVGSVLKTSMGGTTSATSVKGSGTLALNGVAQLPNDTAQSIEVGENAAGKGVVVTDGTKVAVASGTSSLESVSCTTDTQCYAVGLGPSNADEGVLVSIKSGKPVSTTPLPTFIGLYGISCPTTSTCYAVGYDNSDDADAVTTITNGVAAPLVEVDAGQGVGEWLNAISCPTATQCEAVGIVNYLPAFVPITSGVPGTPVTITDGGNAWYVNGVDCTSANNCVAVGENDTEQGIVSTLVDGAYGTTQVVPNSINSYGVACDAAQNCLITGASNPDADGVSVGTVSRFVLGTPYDTRAEGNTNGFGQLACNASLSDCVSAGAAYEK